jgi:hypothetical protein
MLDAQRAAHPRGEHDGRLTGSIGPIRLTSPDTAWQLDAAQKDPSRRNAVELDAVLARHRLVAAVAADALRFEANETGLLREA